MKTYEFTLTFRLADSNENAEKYIDALAEHGCDDALVGLGKLGSISLDFSREAKTAIEALSSAVQNVCHAIPDATLIEVGPDFVGLTDIADMLGVSRQYARKLVLSNVGSFPDPIYQGSPSLWSLADVTDWLQHNAKLKNSAEDLVEMARLTRQINFYRDSIKVQKSSVIYCDVVLKSKKEKSELQRWLKPIFDAFKSPKELLARQP